MNQIVPNFPYQPSETLINDFCEDVYTVLQGKRQCILSGLLESYNHSINGRYIQARDLILKYHIPDLGISDAKITAAYNRALVQLGFCAFEQGDYDSCKQNLDEICSTFRLKELLCQ